MEGTSRMSIEQSRKQAQTKNNLQFLALTLAVILGVSLEESAKSVVHSIISKGDIITGFIENPFFILQFTTLLIVIDVYLAMYKFHLELEVPYIPAFLFSDVFFIALPIIVLVESLVATNGISNGIYHEKYFLVLSVILGMLFVRQMIPWIWAKIDDRGRKKKREVPIKLLLPCISDIIGIIYCVIAFKFVKNNPDTFLHFSVGALIMFGFYFFTTHIFRIGISTKKVGFLGDE
jgi:hypothetical protein